MAEPDRANSPPPPPPPERKAPEFTFYDEESNRYRPQFTVAGRRHHPSLRKPDGGIVRAGDERYVAAAMAAYCRELISAGVLTATSDVAVKYVGDGAEVTPLPLPPRGPPPAAPGPAAKSELPKRSAVRGWHGMLMAAMEVDHKLIAALTPDGSAAKVVVPPGTPAARKLRTGDYVVSIGLNGQEVSFADFDTLCLPANVEVLVRFHRPGRSRPGEIEFALFKLRRRPGSTKPRWWQLLPAVECGREVERGLDRAQFEEQIVTHPHIGGVGLKILIRLLRKHYNDRGACPAYRTLARDLHCSPRAAFENLQHLQRQGVLRAFIGEGMAGKGGVTNRYTIHWPAGWAPPEKTKRCT
jgi:hypothetical protein